MVQTQFEVKVKCVRTDNGGEFTGASFQTLLTDHGINHQKTTPYMPQQNGMVERKHRHLLQLARSLMMEASMPDQFWAHSLLMATHIINRLPTVVLEWRTPYELLYGRQPDYSTLKVFGCLAYATNTKPHKGKFEARAYRCALLGFSPGQKAYKLYNMDTKQILISSDVIFYENIFPFKSMSAKTTQENESTTPLPIIGDIPQDSNSLEEETVNTPTIDNENQNQGIEEDNRR